MVVIPDDDGELLKLQQKYASSLSTQGIMHESRNHMINVGNNGILPVN